VSVEFPRNILTEAIEANARRNAAGGGHATGEPRPTVRSAAMARALESNAQLEPMTPERIAELDALALAAGVVDPRLGNTEQVEGEYASLEEALAAGAPVERPAEPVKYAVVNGRLSGQQSNVNRPPVSPRVVAAPRLPDFKNVQGIDLISGVVYVDDMEFTISASELTFLRSFAVDVARTEVLKKLEEASGLFTQVTPAEAKHGEETEGS